MQNVIHTACKISFFYFFLLFFKGIWILVLNPVATPFPLIQHVPSVKLALATNTSFDFKKDFSFCRNKIQFENH